MLDIAKYESLSRYCKTKKGGEHNKSTKIKNLLQDSKGFRLCIRKPHITDSGNDYVICFMSQKYKYFSGNGIMYLQTNI